jgi:peptidoglycan/LPS O-acetylase OafA/YrhL
MSIGSKEVPSASASAFLDLSRWAAAWLVMLGHVRNHVFPEYLAVASLPGSIPHLIPWLGREAVIVFFVLSGFLVGGTLLRTSASPKDLRHYFIARLTRLYIVLVPALLLFLAIGVAIREWMPEEGASLNRWISPRLLAINLAFLQTIAGPTFADDYPLWSIANEFWYYAAFPLLLLAWRGRTRSPSMSWAWAFLLATLLYAVGFKIASYFLVWLVGLAPAALKRPLLRPGAALATLAGAVLLSHLWRGPEEAFLPDFLVAVAFALLIHAVVRSDFRSRWMERTAAVHATLADFSFSLYVLHAPLATAAMLVMYGAHPSLDPRDPGAAAVYFALCAGLVLVSFAFGQLTERQTRRMRRWLERITGPRT